MDSFDRFIEYLTEAATAEAYATSPTMKAYERLMFHLDFSIPEDNIGRKIRLNLREVALKVNLEISVNLSDERIDLLAKHVALVAHRLFLEYSKLFGLDVDELLKHRTITDQLKIAYS